MFFDLRAGPDEQLFRLEANLQGYSSALLLHGIDEPGARFLVEFAWYLYSTRGWSGSNGAIRAILEHSGTADEAWEEFWRLVAEYRDAESPRFQDVDSDEDA